MSQNLHHRGGLFLKFVQVLVSLLDVFVQGLNNCMKVPGFRSSAAQNRLDVDPMQAILSS
jgi:hypothetical protein